MEWLVIAMIALNTVLVFWIFIYVKTSLENLKIIIEGINRSLQISHASLNTLQQIEEAQNSLQHTKIAQRQETFSYGSTYGSLSQSLEPKPKSSYKEWSKKNT